MWQGPGPAPLAWPGCTAAGSNGSRTRLFPAYAVPNKVGKTRSSAPPAVKVHVNAYFAFHLPVLPQKNSLPPLKPSSALLVFSTAPASVISIRAVTFSEPNLQVSPNVQLVRLALPFET